MSRFFSGKKVIVVGFGREGVSTVKYLNDLGDAEKIGIADIKLREDLGTEAISLLAENPKLTTHFGENYLDKLNEYDVIVRSPGISPYLKEIIGVRKDGTILTSQTKIFFDQFPGVIAGVTGTKGKSTTASLIFNILREAGKDALLVGNIGKPALDVLRDSKSETIAVYEMSSHQLVDLDKSPHVAVLLDMAAEHLDYYKSSDQYFEAKANIAKYQKSSDYLILNPSHEQPAKISNLSNANLINISLEEKDCPGAYLQNGSLFYCENDEKSIREIITADEVPLIGKFNIENVLPAIAATSVLGVTVENQKEAIFKFEPLPHRLEKVGVYKGIEFYNDSLSTLPESAVAALDALGNKVETIILGGSDRNLSFKGLAESIGESSVKTVILFPTSGTRIEDAIKLSASKVKTVLVDSMKEAVELAYTNTGTGKICLMSPASPSFSMFSDYAERGDEFRRLVNKLGRQ